jgi:hypothetical protein
MKEQIDEAHRNYAIVSTGEKARPEDSAGQSIDTQGLPGVAEAGSEGVTELIEELTLEDILSVPTCREAPMHAGKPPAGTKATPTLRARDAPILFGPERLF